MCRDDYPKSAYEIYAGIDKPKVRDDGWFRSDAGPIWDFCPTAWEKEMPKSLHLKPGGGPIRIRVEVVK